MEGIACFCCWARYPQAAPAPAGQGLTAGSASAMLPPVQGPAKFVQALRNALRRRSQGALEASPAPLTPADRIERRVRRTAGALVCAAAAHAT